MSFWLHRLIVTTTHKLAQANSDAVLISDCICNAWNRSKVLHHVPLLISLSGRSQHVIGMRCANDEWGNIIDTVNHQCELNCCCAFSMCEKRGSDKKRERRVRLQDCNIAQGKAAAATVAAKPADSRSSMKWSHLEGEMEREMGCREKRVVGGDEWVDGRIRGIACQAFWTRILSYTAPTRCPSHMHTYVHVCPHTFASVCVHALAIFDQKK